MKNAVIIHGRPDKEEYYDFQYESSSNMHWFPWLQKNLVKRYILAQTPEMPKPYEPTYEDWRDMFEGFKITEDTILVGHSCGGGFLVRWLSESKVKVGKVVLVAPWLDPLKSLKTGMFDFGIDPNIVSKTNGIIIFVSDDDNDDILMTVKLIEEKVKGVKVIRETGMGHFTFGSMNTREFPKLLEEVLDEK